MESAKSPTGAARRHVPRRSARGPLTAADDPLANPPPPESPSKDSTHSWEPASRASLDVGSLDAPRPLVDLRFLQDGEHYARIPTNDINEAFLTSPLQPSADAPLATLLQHGHFRHAAEKALDDLLKCSPNDGSGIFELLYTRLACLILITRVDLAVHESAPIIDFLAHGHSDVADVLSYMPWELRLLLVRLQSIGAADGGRRGMMSLYTLAAEVRQHVKAAKDADKSDQLKIWSQRLCDLGLRVADALVEMGELETAARHLDTLSDADESGVAYRKALVTLRLGDLTAAKVCIATVSNARQKSSLEASLTAATGDFDEAVKRWQKDSEDGENALSASNLAVGLLYTGRIAEAKAILESLVDRLPAFSGALFNLGTVYELCSEHAVDLKQDLIQRTARKNPVPDTGGWERANFEFKL